MMMLIYRIVIATIILAIMLLSSLIIKMADILTWEKYNTTFFVPLAVDMIVSCVEVAHLLKVANRDRIYSYLRKKHPHLSKELK